jgi:hypothetical protein
MISPNFYQDINLTEKFYHTQQIEIPYINRLITSFFIIISIYLVIKFYKNEKRKNKRN